MNDITKVLVELYFDDGEQPVLVVLGKDDLESLQTTIDAVIYMEKNGAPAPLPTNEVLH